MLKVDVEPLAPKLLNNRKAHSHYLRHTQEQAAILREVVEQGKSQNPLNNSLDHAYKYTKRIQELLIIIRQTCPCINNLSDKLVAVTPKNKDKRVRFTEPVTSSGNTNTKTASLSYLISKKPMLSSTRVKLSTSASRSQPLGNTKKDKIQQPPSGTQKNKVEAHPRTVKFSFKNKNYAVETKVTVTVPHSKLNTNSELIVLSVMVVCFLIIMIGKVFTNIGYIWRPTDQTFTIEGNVCPLTRITTTTEVPSRNPIAIETDTPKPIVTLVYSRKPRKSKTTIPVSKSKQNGFVERRNRTLIEAACTMLIYAKALLFLWAEAVATACYTQNRSIIRLCHGKTPYELLHNKPPDLSFLHVFGTLCYPTNDSEYLGKLQPKADIGIFIGYAPTKKAFQIYNRRTRQIIETIHVDLDELTVMASKHSSLGPALHEMTPATISLGLVPNPPP
nr:retrovirus-related Pol polyprotein from transposon TNT 1-94 [Tanacetum cinerariifolium]